MPPDATAAAALQLMDTLGPDEAWVHLTVKANRFRVLEADQDLTEILQIRAALALLIRQARQRGECRS